MRGSVRALRIALAAAGLASIGISAWLVLGPSGQGLNVRPIALALVGYAMLVGMDWLGSDDDSRTAQALQRLAAGGLLGLLMIVIRDWHIEGPPFAQGIAPIVFFGFLVHHSLSPKWRPTLFLLLSLAAILLIFGTTGAWIVAIGIVLVGLCHLPVDWRLRAGLASAAGLTLILMRGGTIDSPWPAAIWPIIASIFMFRLIVYLYDLKNGKIPESWPRRLSYFFLLPNPAFPLFPVVDAQTYFSQYFRTDAGALYLRGITWMTRGIVHLLLYRFIYRELAMSAVDVHTGGQLVLYLLTNFGLYLRISGQFHLAIGVLHLFGHGLPLTNNWYWLASSFSDFWRRINIYWKEFMQKLIFFPVFMKIRNWRFGETAAVIAASLLVFVATWFLHSYQWFWILGTWLITGPDILFWSILALLMTANTLWERRKGAKKLAKRAGARARVGLALRTVGVFTTITVLWSLWNSPSIGEFFRLFEVVEWGAATTWLWLVAYVGIAGAIATVARAVSEGGFGLDAPKREFMPQVATIGVVLAALAVGVRPVVTERMSLEAQVAFRAIRRGELSERDAELIRRGYYENLVLAGRLNSRAWETTSTRPDDWQFIQFTDAGRYTNDFFEKELVPNASIIFHAAPFRVNRWGFRDLDYPRSPEPGTYRVALLGASYLLGSGVADDESFESLVEVRLNEAVPTGYERYELLNFGLPGFEPLRNALLLDRALEFEPDAVWVFASGSRGTNARIHLAGMARRGIEMPDPFLADVVERAGIRVGMTEADAERLLAPFDAELLEWAYTRIARRTAEAGVQAVWLFLPPTETATPEREFAEGAPHIEALGFHVVDLSRVYRSAPIEELVVAPWDGHPNPRAHRLIADTLWSHLMARPVLIGGADSTVARPDAGSGGPGRH